MHEVHVSLNLKFTVRLPTFTEVDRQRYLQGALKNPGNSHESAEDITAFISKSFAAQKLLNTMLRDRSELFEDFVMAQIAESWDVLRPDTRPVEDVLKMAVALLPPETSTKFSEEAELETGLFFADFTELFYLDNPVGKTELLSWEMSVP